MNARAMLSMPARSLSRRWPVSNLPLCTSVRVFPIGRDNFRAEEAWGIFSRVNTTAVLESEIINYIASLIVNLGNVTVAMVSFIGFAVPMFSHVVFTWVVQCVPRLGKKMTRTCASNY